MFLLDQPRGTGDYRASCAEYRFWIAQPERSDPFGPAIETMRQIPDSDFSIVVDLRDQSLRCQLCRAMRRNALPQPRQPVRREREAHRVSVTAEAMKQRSRRIDGIRGKNCIQQMETRNGPAGAMRGPVFACNDQRGSPRPFHYARSQDADNASMPVRAVEDDAICWVRSVHVDQRNQFLFDPVQRCGLGVAPLLVQTVEFLREFVCTCDIARQKHLHYV